jgi:Cu(I)/Ag(I) efflux system protein CusF
LILLSILFSSCQKQSSETKPASTPAGKPISVTGPPGFPPPVLNKPYPGSGVVATINRNEGWIEINHEEIKDLMPAMQMEFNVKEKSLLDRVKIGERVDFTIVETEKGEYLIDIKPTAKL